YWAETEIYDRMEAGKLRLAIGKTRISSEITWDEDAISFAVLHLGDHNLNGGVRKFMGDEAFSTMHQEIREAFDRGAIPDVIRLMDKHFGINNYSLWHLFKDEQRKVLGQVLHSTLEGIEISFRKIYEENYPIMSFLQSLQMPLPRPLLLAAEYVINLDLRRIFEGEEFNGEKLENLIEEAKRWSLEIDKDTTGFVVNSWINSLMEKLHQTPEELPLFEQIEKALGLLSPLAIDLDLWKAQNRYFAIGKERYPLMKERAEKEDNFAKSWVEHFRQLGAYLHVRVE
ncbi:MAG: DUF3536 domain-containing protein, partial [Deltaproteobacteria bacterium]|nr:DUF3536 domain-containing protein [Deltaproteobacteria bacterium]